jgi:subfamily B ATP-binding cassette protein MsbA
LAISALLLGFTVCKGIAEYFSSYLMAKIGQSAVLELRRELYDHLLRQPASFFEKHRTNYLVSRLVVSCSAIELAVCVRVSCWFSSSARLSILTGGLCSAR